MFALWCETDMQKKSINSHLLSVRPTPVVAIDAWPNRVEECRYGNVPALARRCAR